MFKTMSLEELMDQEVTSVSRQSEPLTTAPAAIQVINSEQIRRSGASSLPEALRLASNLQVAQVTSSEWAISARGFNNLFANKLLVMIDGRTVYTPLFAGVFWDQQDTFMPDIDRIEVISGPGATLWGSNAVNGVINVTTKSSEETQGLLVEGGGGNEQRAFAGLRYGGEAAPNLHYRFYGKYFSRDGVVLASGDSAEDEWQMGQGGMRADWDVGTADRATLQGDVYRGDLEQPGPDASMTSGGNALGRWRHAIAADSDLALTMYYDLSHRSLPGSITETLDTYDADFQHRFPLGDRNQVVWGLGYRLYDDDIDNASSSAFLPAHVVHDLVSAFAQDEVALIEDTLFWTIGSKVEHNDYTGVEVQPSTRLSWLFADNQNLWSAVSRAVRTPARVDRDHFVPANPPFILAGGPEFDAEKVWAYELGYRCRPHDLVSLSLALFYNDYDDIRTVEQETPPAPIPLVIGNGSRGETYGSELTVDYQTTEWWRLGFGYTELRVHMQSKPGSTDPEPEGESNDPEHWYSLRSSMNLPWRCELDAMYRYVDSIARQDLPQYDELDLRLGWNPTQDLELSLVGQSLLHEDHAEFGSPTQRREIERSAYIKVAWDF